MLTIDPWKTKNGGQLSQRHECGVAPAALRLVVGSSGDEMVGNGSDEPVKNLFNQAGLKVITAQPMGT